MKKRIVMLTLTGAAMVFATTGCGTKENAAEPTTSVTEETAAETDTETTQIPNPWTDCENMEEAEANTGFSMEVPDAIGEYTKTLIQTLDQEIIQVFYEKAGTDDSILIRKGTGLDDISGDYNEYEQVETKQIDDVTVTVKENDGKYYLATWQADGYTYSVSDEQGLGLDKFVQMIELLR